MNQCLICKSYGRILSEIILRRGLFPRWEKIVMNSSTYMAV